MTKKITLGAFYCVLCMMVSFLEFLLPPVPLVPGLKLGLANAPVMVLLANGRIREGVAVNTVRILLSAFLFSGVAALPYSLSGALFSTLVVLLLRKTKLFSAAGLSTAGAAVHNLAQLSVCAFFYGTAAVLNIAPLLVAVGAVCGFLVGLLSLCLSCRMPDLS